MSKTIKIIKDNKGSLISILSSLFLIAISWFTDPSTSNAFWGRIVFFLYCIRFELLLILIFIVLYLLFSRFFQSARTITPALYFIMIAFIVITIMVSVEPAEKYVIARYYYFNNNLHKDESVKHYIDNAHKYMNEKDWDLCVQNLSKADMLYPDSRYSSDIEAAINEANFYIEYGECLYNSYIKNVANNTLNTFKCAQALSELYPSKYMTEYLALRSDVASAINSYPQLYEAVTAKNYEECHELILKYGWCWFEPIICNKLSHDDKNTVMNWLNQYIQFEDVFSAQCRMINNWFGDIPVSTIIQ